METQVIKPQPLMKGFDETFFERFSRLKNLTGWSSLELGDVFYRMRLLKLRLCSL
jgi:hypothetical protein